MKHITFKKMMKKYNQVIGELKLIETRNVAFKINLALAWKSEYYSLSYNIWIDGDYSKSQCCSEDSRTGLYDNNMSKSDRSFFKKQIKNEPDRQGCVYVNIEDYYAGIYSILCGCREVTSKCLKDDGILKLSHFEKEKITIEVPYINYN